MRRSILALVLVIVTAGSSSAITLTDRMHSIIRKGNKHYHSGEHRGALDEYLRAEDVDSTSVVPRFNAGDALYRLGRYSEGARKFLGSASAPEDSIASMSYYNLGNAMFKAGDIQSAIEAYKRALLIEPDDRDAKFNLEFAMKTLEEQEQQQDQSQQDGRDEQDQRDETGDGRQQERQQKDAGDDQQGQQSQEPPDRQQPEQGQQTEPQDQPSDDGRQQPEPREISPEELQRIMAAIEASDRNTQQELLKQKSRRRTIRGKDW
jgi:tetratricopeptide (TPR) repeat protein